MARLRPMHVVRVADANVGDVLLAFLSLELQDLAVSNCKSDGLSIVVVPSSSQRKSSVLRPSERHAVPDLPEFPPRVAMALRLSEPTNTHHDGDGYTADDRKRGAHLSSDKMRKRLASNSFEYIVAERTNHQKFQNRPLAPR